MTERQHYLSPKCKSCGEILSNKTRNKHLVCHYCLTNAPEESRCKALRKNKKRCKCYALHGEYCQWHRQD